MSPLSTFFVANIVPVLFVYGLAFFSMGFAIMLESRRTSELPIARSMSLLAGFGLVHGLHEWVDMAQVLAVRDYPGVYSWPVETIRLALPGLLLSSALRLRLTPAGRREAVAVGHLALYHRRGLCLGADLLSRGVSPWDCRSGSGLPSPMF